MSNLYNEISNISSNWLKQAFKLRTSGIYRQKLYEEIHNSPACLNYTMMTVDVKLQNYLSALPKQHSIAISMFKCGNHKLPIVSGRYRNISLEDRICSLCDHNDVGDETHYLFICPYFINSRKKYIKKYYYIIVKLICTDT